MTLTTPQLTYLIMQCGGALMDKDAFKATDVIELRAILEEEKEKR